LNVDIAFTVIIVLIAVVKKPAFIAIFIIISTTALI